jgi:predicted membrane metal-binding protein
MKNGWNIFEKICALVEIALGVGLLYGVCSTIYNIEGGIINDRRLFIEQPSVWEKVSMNKMESITGLIFLTVGILLLFNKKVGWIITVSICLFSLIIAVASCYPFNGYDVFGLLVAFIMLILVGCLIQGHFISKYKISGIHWMVIGLVVVIGSLAAKFIH